MFHVRATSLEWALKHIRRYYSSDFFPAAFEFDAISDQWSTVKTHIRSLDLESYVPRTPVTLLAPKPNGTFRVVHHLDPVDALLYAALIFEISEIVEAYRVPASAEIACSYRISPEIDGSFFAKDSDWDVYAARTKALCRQYKTGFVITCDFVDFYNQIYTHRVRHLIEEAGGRAFERHAKIIERFLVSLNTETSRGVPVGPAPSVVLSELIMGDIDKKLLTYTRDFVRWADDMRIFFSTRAEAELVLHDLTEFVHSNHRLVFSGEKTRITTVGRFVETLKDDASEEAKVIAAKTEELALSEYYDELIKKLGPYEDPEAAWDVDAYAEVLDDIAKSRRFEILSDVYADLLSAEVKRPYPHLALLRRIFRNAARYRIRSILPIGLAHFDSLVPVVRELVLYLHKVIDKKVIASNSSAFKKIISSPRMQLTYVNMWVSNLLQNPAFGTLDVPQYSVVSALRDKALVARRRSDRTWIKGYKNRIDVLGPWEKRAVLFAASILSKDETSQWLKVAAARGDITEAAVAKFVMRTKSP